MSAISPATQPSPANGEFQPACRHQLHADADAEERLANLPTFLQRLDHAGHSDQPAPAIGEGADARQHDALRPAHHIPDRR